LVGEEEIADCRYQISDFRYMRKHRSEEREVRSEESGRKNWSGGVVENPEL
jgi:hypothetical protein